LQVRKGGLPPLKLHGHSPLRSQFKVELPCSLSGGKPPFPTCKLSDLELSPVSERQCQKRKPDWVEVSGSFFMRLFTRCLLLTIVALGTVSAQSASKRGLVANLKDNAVANGCGCYFRFRGTPRNAERYIFFSSIEDDKTAWMNIGGGDVELTLVKQTGLKGREEQGVGSRSTIKYTSGDITVSETSVVTRVCDPNDENCESTDYNVTFVIKKGPKSQVVKAVGSCGC
jgi:hypothetical protein